jgi:hypothetical protein
MVEGSLAFFRMSPPMGFLTMIRHMAKNVMNLNTIEYIDVFFFT